MSPTSIGTKPVSVGQRLKPDWRTSKMGYKFDRNDSLETPGAVGLIGYDYRIGLGALLGAFVNNIYDAAVANGMPVARNGKRPKEVWNSYNTTSDLFQEGQCKAALLFKKSKPIPNHYYTLNHHETSVVTVYNPITAMMELVKKKAAFKIQPRNIEQICSLDAILNPNISLVTLQGVAGTGKTLLSLAGALEQRRNFHQIYLARPIVPLSNKDIGFLPGDIKSKLNPYMEPLWDNLKYIKNCFSEKDKEYRQINEMVENEKLVVCPLAYIRGRSFSNVFFIVDEAQNLTPHEVKTIITRAGENTKIIFTGDIYQIDTPYLDSRSNGLSYLIDRIKGSRIYAHVTLERGERSELANLANDLL